MAVKEVWEDLDGARVGRLINWRQNPLSTSQRLSLGNSLNSSHIGLPVYDIDLLKVFYWEGTQWSTNTTSTPGSGTIDLIAGEIISSGMVVIIFTDGKVYKYDINDESHAGLTCGIAKTSGISGNTITITLPGEIHVEVGSGWQAGISYYVASNSLLSSTAPTVGIVKKIGTGITTDTILVNNYDELILI